MLSVVPGAVEDLAGNLLAVGGSTTWVADLTAPQASGGSGTGVSAAGGTAKVTVTYTDAVGISASSVDSSDIRVTGPNGYAQLAVFQSVTGAATSRTAVYNAAAPAGGWQAVHNGTYTAALVGSQVTDTAGNPVPAAAGLAAFDVAIPPAVTSVVVNDGAAQRSVVKSLTVNFSAPVELSAGAITLAGRNGAGAGTVVSVAPSTGAAQSFTLTFIGGPVVGGSLADGVYDLTVLASAVSTPSGPTMASNYAFEFHRLFSDSDGDGDSDNADLFQMRGTYNKIFPDPAYKGTFDYDGDGDVDNADVFQVRARRSITFQGY